MTLRISSTMATTVISNRKIAKHLKKTGGNGGKSRVDELTGFFIVERKVKVSR